MKKMLHQTRVLLDQAVALESAGHWQSAVAKCEAAFQQSVRDGDLRHLVEAVLRTGYCYLRMEDRELAQEQLQLAVELAVLHDLQSTAARATNSIAILHQRHGDMDEAERLYHRARVFAMADNDAHTAGSIDQNLGTLANLRGNLEEALEHYQSALQLFEETGHERGVAGVLNNLGMLHTDLGQLSHATECLERALQVARTIPDVVTEAIVHINRTELFIARNELHQARISCDEAFEITSRIEDNACRAEALKFYGIIYKETGKPHLADIHLRQAVEIAQRYEYPLHEAECQRELALVLRMQGQNRESLAALNRAHALFRKLRAQREQADVDNRIAQLEDDFLSIVQMWGESIEAKDRYTRGHCQRVADYACRIARSAGVDEGEMVWFRMGAFLHDVGKTEVPEEILNKPGKLSEEERLLMERHTVIGDEMLSSIEFPWDVRPMVRSHHERWDGKGYPDRLSGFDIPLTARILRLADIFDALTTTRSYRAPLSPEEAYQIMVEDEGSFDPTLFAIFEHLFPELRHMAAANSPADVTGS